MGYTATAFTAGSTLTAAQMEVLRDSTNNGHCVFINEAARDAAITAPVEGMYAYLTAPTVPAATGDTTAVPTGVQTIYNGSAWVCVTQVSSFTSATGTVTSTSFTASLSGSPGTNPSVTLSTGTSALITVSSSQWNSGAGGSVMGIAVSGASTVTADDYRGNETGSGITTVVSCARSTVITGLTAGTNTFTLQYRVGGGTGTFRNRAITVQGIA